MGVYPFDESRALSLCHLEEPQEDHDELVDAVLGIIQDRCDFREQKKKEALEFEQRTERLKGKKQFFTSKHAQVLTTPANIAYIRLDNDWKSVKEKKSAELTEWILQQPEFTEDDLKKDRTSKKKNMKELQGMVFEMFKARHATLERITEQWIQQRQVILPSTDALLHGAPQESTVLPFSITSQPTSHTPQSRMPQPSHLPISHNISQPTSHTPQSRMPRPSHLPISHNISQPTSSYPSTPQLPLHPLITPQTNTPASAFSTLLASSLVRAPNVSPVVFRSSLALVACAPITTASFPSAFSALLTRNRLLPSK